MNRPINLFDPTTGTVTLVSGETVQVPGWVADAVRECTHDDPAGIVRFWLRSTGQISPDDEVGFLDLSGEALTPLEAEVVIEDCVELTAPVA